MAASSLQLQNHGSYIAQENYPHVHAFHYTRPDNGLPGALAIPEYSQQVALAVPVAMYYF